MEKVIRIILSGCSGRMGRVIAQMAGEDDTLVIAAGVDPYNDGTCGFPVFPDFKSCSAEADVIVDFSSPKAFDEMIAFSKEHHIPTVVCTTGLSEEQLGVLDEAAREVAVLRSANMSVGINLMMKVLKEISATLTGAGFDVEIVERHHRNKKDAPSGTAISLADSINEAHGGAFHYVYDRTGRYEAREKDELGISAVRGGSIVGDHEVIFAGTDEVFEIRHTAYSRAIFARGALEAAKFMAYREPGFYTMSDVIGEGAE